MLQKAKKMVSTLELRLVEQERCRPVCNFNALQKRTVLSLELPHARLHLMFEALSQLVHGRLLPRFQISHQGHQIGVATRRGRHGGEIGGGVAKGKLQAPVRQCCNGHRAHTPCPSPPTGPDSMSECCCTHAVLNTWKRSLV